MRDSQHEAVHRARDRPRPLTDAERLLWARLEQQVAGSFCTRHPIGPYIADFACPQSHLVVEIGEDAQPAGERNDIKRSYYLKAHGWHVVRLTDEDIVQRLDNVLEEIRLHMRV